MKTKRSDKREAELRIQRTVKAFYSHGQLPGPLATVLTTIGAPLSEVSGPCYDKYGRPWTERTLKAYKKGIDY